ncbi:DUF4132 domain-containing protein [Flavobacterium procerum]|uniref:DUF4132 domain-containing protein n=1 Tax=Flavobacterium procerum TaxID=1455569 RepID=A0ABV6C1H9_9FLAO
MNILEQIFQLENPKLEYKISEELHNLLFDWFNESKISITVFEKELFEPLFEEIVQKNENIQQYYDEARRSTYIQYAFKYVMYHNPNNAMLEKFFKLDDRGIVNNVVSSYKTHGKADPNLYKILNTGTEIARYYHAIYARIDQNYSYLPCNFAQLKFDEHVHFNTIFDYVNQQHFEEKPYMLFLISKSHTQKYDRNSEASEIISKTEYDALIETAFENSISKYNETYNRSLSKEMFLLLKDFLEFKPVDKKAKITFDTFEEAKILIEKTKGREIEIFEHIFYFLRNEYMYEKDKYWNVLLSALCRNMDCTANWLHKKVLFLLLPDNKYNFNLIFSHITSLLQKQAQQFHYHDGLVKDYETLLFKNTIIAPNENGLVFLRTVAENIESKSLKKFTLQKLGSYYFDARNAFDFSYFSYDEKDKSFKTIKQFIDDLNYLTPVALKKVNKPIYYESEKDDIFNINYLGEDIGICRHYFVRDINAVLTKAESPYRLVSIPLQQIKERYNREENILFSLAFMNEEEHEFFRQEYLTDKNAKNWWFERSYSSYDIFFKHLKEAPNVNPEFSHSTTVSFQELKNTKNDAGSSQPQNAFLEDINWKWFKDQYIDELNSKESWYEIMNVICQSPKGKKPTTAWLSELKTVIEKLGTEKYFKELQVLLSLSLKEESWFFDLYANALKGLIWSCAYISPNDLSLSILKTIIEFSYAKVYGVGAKSVTTGNLALEALIGTQKEEAFGILNIMRNKTKYNKFVTVLEKYMDKFKENSTIPEQLLADKSIPNFGFLDGKKNFEIADWTLIISFKNKKIVKEWQHNDGQISKQTPALITSDYAKDLKEVNEEIKQINTIFNDLKKRIKTYWLYDRSWQFSDWEKFIKNHDLLYPHIDGLIWSNITNGKDFILINHEMLDFENNKVISNPDDEISLWHPVKNDEKNTIAWQDYLWKNKIIQSERQAYRENYPFSETELQLSETPRFANHFLEVKKLMAVANSVGWIFTYEHEGVNWPRAFFKPLNITAHIVCDYDRYSYAIPTKQLYFTENNSTKINDDKAQQGFEKIKLATVPLVALSEICRDIDLFIATTSVANNIELSENKQEYKSYRTEYEKGLFSDNANAKIRKQIIEQIKSVLKLNVAGFDGNYVIVKGINENFRINLNSGFAQSNETQKHINLIPEISSLKSNKKLRLPIEDDETLYIILAKILYLQTQ